MTSHSNFETSISVVMPVFNGAKTLARSLDSLVGEDIDAVLVDQASTDGSRQIAENYAGKLNLTIIDAPDSKTWMQNTNIGIKAAQGKFISMLHQDDFWVAGRAKIMKKLITRFPEAVIWLHPASYVDSNDNTIGMIGPRFGKEPRLVQSSDALRTFMVQNTISLPAAIFRRQDALQIEGLDEALWYTADWDFWLKLAKTGPVAWTPEKLASFRVHSESLTVKGSKIESDFIAQLEIPLDRHISALDVEDQATTRALAETSNKLNVRLATGFHTRKIGIWTILVSLIQLGPTNWPAFFRNTQIVARVLPRIRLLFQRRKENQA